MRERAIQVEVAGQLAGEQRVHLVDVDPTGQEVGLAPSQLAGTRPGEEKPEAARMLVQENLHHVEQGRDALYLVQEHGADVGRCGMEFVLEALRVGDEIAEDPWAGEIQGEIGCQGGQEGGLADLPRAEDQDAALVGAEGFGERSWVHVGRIAGFLPANKIRDGGKELGKGASVGSIIPLGVLLYCHIL